PKPEPAPVVKKDEPLKETFFYQIRMSDVNDDAKVAKIVEWCNEYPNKTIVVSGYADKGTGNARVNKKYAEQRAFKVADAIKAKGVSADRIMVESYGDTVQPFAENDQNRCTIVVGE
ncbi:MAG: OmpA family protein, partial [Prevotellaceae bacterium]|nr:OmpA family protein [Prevotellaceae bacterium]